MRKPHLILLIVAMVLVLITLASLTLTGSGSSGPRLIVNYLRQTNYAGYVTAWFAVTNVGDATAVSYPVGCVAVDGQPIVSALCKSTYHELQPGQGDVIEAFPHTTPIGRWRFIAQYARLGLRTRIMDFQWGPHGPGARVNWLIPRSLKGVRLDVMATSNWVNVNAPTNLAPISVTK